MGYTLTPQELETYRRDGLVMPNTHLPDEAYQLAKRTVNGIIDRATENTREFTNVAHIPKRAGVPEGLDGGEEIFKLATSPAVVDFVEQCIGPDVVLWGTSIFAKPAGFGRAVQWHQDSNWWPMRPLVTCTMWLAIDDANVSNGCLRYIPGSHDWDVLPHLDEKAQGLLGSNIGQDLIDEKTARDVVLKAGQFSLHQANLVHGSNENNSTKRRAGLVMRYMPASSLFTREEDEAMVQRSLMKTGYTVTYAERPIWLVRGESRHPRNDYRVGHKNLEDLDAIAENARQAAKAWTPAHA